MSPRYAELSCRSGFSFLEGASMPEELVARAVELGLEGLAITDRDGVYGVVRAHRAARAAGLPLALGATLTIRERPPLVLLARNRRGWANLCRILTEGRRGRPKGEALHEPRFVLEHAGGLLALLQGPWSRDHALPFREAFGEWLYVTASPEGLSTDAALFGRAAGLARALGVRPLIVGDVLMHHPDRKRLLDVLTCIRRRVTLDRAGRALAPNAARVLRSPERMAALARGLGSPWEAAPEETARLHRACAFGLEALDYCYPREIVPEGHTPMSWLRVLCERGLRDRYPAGVAQEVRRQVERELRIIGELDYPAYFLTVYDMVRFARERGILCQGRGSAANSAVCYVLGITSVDPERSRLLFERFISAERDEPPDIDVDFEHERREEVIQYVYDRYGRDRAAMVNEVIRWRRRSAIRDVGRVMDLSLDQVDQLCRHTERWGREPLTADRIREAGLDPADRRVALTLELVEEMQGFPRHVSIHVGGMVLTDDALVSRVPVEPATMEDRTVIQWDKDDIDEVGFVKVDLLSLGMLTAIRRAFQLLAGYRAPGGAPFPYGRTWTMASVPAEDPAVYDMVDRADTMGVFQIESRAQMSMLPRLRPRCFYDLVIEVSIVRPGPIQGGMVHPYLERRQGRESVTYPHPRLVPILERTLGVPIFQEQVMAMAVEVAGFTAGEADALRRAMGAWRRKGTLGEISKRLYRGLLENGIEGVYADRIVQQIQGFGEYGFPESHAASFALLVYVSAWLKCHCPAAFVAALVNSRPMGFYAPRSLFADARRHGVETRPVDVCRSEVACTLEPPEEPGGEPAVRLGLDLVKGLGESAAARVVAAREERPFRHLSDVAARADLDRGSTSALARADAFRGLGIGRREALWQVEGLWTTPLFRGLPRRDDHVSFPEPSAVQELEADHASTGVSVRSHPLALVRPRLDRRGVLTTHALGRTADGSTVRVAGLVTSRQRPRTASGVVFLSLEDETGMVNVVVWPRLYERQRALVRGRNLLEVEGRLQRMDEAVSVLARRFRPLDLPGLSEIRSRDFH